jgi:hypothetical protein
MFGQNYVWTELVNAWFWYVWTGFVKWVWTGFVKWVWTGLVW